MVHGGPFPATSDGRSTSVGTLAIGTAGAVNAALLAASIVGNKHPETREAVRRYRDAQTRRVLADSDPRKPAPGTSGAA